MKSYRAILSFITCKRFQSNAAKYIPKSEPFTYEQLQQLINFVGNSNKLVVLTGAGVSTESGIPDYRSENVGMYARLKHKPIQYQDFLKNPEIRRRYWARNYVSWPKFSTIKPNANHIVLSKWELSNKLHWLITQNVDALHTKAGSKKITELHGCTHNVVCLNCNWNISRYNFENIIKSYNENWTAEAGDIAPDGDVVISNDVIETFNVPPCPKCDGILKPDITFFGDNVDKSIVNFSMNKLEGGDSFLIIGSSLEVYSGYRYAIRAKNLGIPIGIINIGRTRADELAEFRLNCQSGKILSAVSKYKKTLL